KLRIKLPKMDFFSDILQARYFQNECEVLKHKVEKDQKMEVFLAQQIDFFEEIILYIEKYSETIKENLK
ncbi:DUF115 domain-containing protein, partial [Campylobacter lari]|nr:DUF115 domain-containing protein [Campylobacter lari]